MSPERSVDVSSERAFSLSGERARKVIHSLYNADVLALARERKGNTIMIRPLVRNGVLLCVLLWLAGCGAKVTSNNPNTITMIGANFSQSAITITQDQTLAFLDDSDNGATHFLVIGKDGQGTTEQGAPDFGGNSGSRIEAGNVLTTHPWKVPGVFHVTCTVHPGMNLTVTVKATP